MSTRICSKCKVEKPLVEFYKAKKEPLGRRYECKKCSKRRETAYKQAAHFGHCKNYAETISRFNLVTNCECCGKQFNSEISSDRKCIDHSGDLIRGIICSRCNLAIGSFGDTLDGVKNAVTYLERTI